MFAAVVAGTLSVVAGVVVAAPDGNGGTVVVTGRPIFNLLEEAAYFADDLVGTLLCLGSTLLLPPVP